MMLQKFMLPLAVCLTLFNCFAFSQQAKPITTSIYIEFGYENVAADDVFGQQMFAKTRYSAYGDESFLVIRKYADNPNPNSMDAVSVEMIKDLKSGKSYSCLDIAGEKFRMDENPKVGDMAAQIFGTDTDTSFTFTKSSDSPITIQGISTEKWQLTQEGLDAISLYLSQEFQPSESLKKFPLFVNRDGKTIGLCLGNDTKMANIYSLRASKIEVDKPQSTAAHLDSFKPGSEEEINAAIKKLLGF